MENSIGIVILAAGEGSRLGIATPKAMITALGKPLIQFAIELGATFLNANDVEGHICVVVGHQKEKLINFIESSYGSPPMVDDGQIKLNTVTQTNQLGTADALKTYLMNDHLSAKREYTLVICVDTPLVQCGQLSNLFRPLQMNKEVDAILASFIVSNPKGYGRIVEEKEGFAIIEEKEGNPEILKIKEVNSGLYIFRTNFLLDKITSINAKNNAKEFYLTDLFQNRYNCQKVVFKDGIRFFGINTLKQLENVEIIMRENIIESLQSQGVRFIDSKSVYLSDNISVGKNSIIYPNVFLEGNVSIGKNVKIGPGCVIKDSKICDDVEIKAYSYLEECVVRARSTIGPFAHLRPKADIGEESKIGNFVEIKKSNLEKGVKVSHLSYIGDASIGEDTNIGCGFITCNYDGENKNKTIIGKKSFIGSDCQTIAPIKIGDEVYVGSGSTINKDVPSGAFAIARTRQTTRAEMASRFLKKKDKKS